MRWAVVVLIVLLLAGVWVLAFFAPELRWFAELLTVVVLLAAILVVAIPWAIERRKESQKSDAAKDAAKDAPAPEKDARELRLRIRKTLSQIDRAVGGRKIARKLPWYLALGGAESRKSAVLDGWGLTNATAPDPDERSPRPSEAPPCEGWCSQDAVVVTVASGGGPEDREREIWLAVLDEVRRARGTRSIEAVLVAADMPEVLSPQTVEPSAAQRLRGRIDDVLDRLNLIVPVYVLLTRAETIPGFLDFWADLPATDDSTWGASFAVDDDALIHEPAKAIARELDVLAEALHTRLLDRLPSAGDPVRRLRMLGFPAEMHALGARISSFLAELCKKGAAPERFALRGFYFVGAGRDTAQASPTRTIAADDGVTAQGGRRYFEADVFRSVILPDRNLASPTARALKQRTRAEIRASLVAVVVSFLVLAPALGNYARNVNLAGTVADTGESLASAPASSIPGTRSDPIERALDVLVQCDSESTSFGIDGWWAPRSARELRAPLRAAYVARLATFFAGRVRQELDRRLDVISSGTGLSDSPSTVDDATPLRDAYDTVKLYATLVDPVGHASSDWAARQLAGVWRAVIPDGDAVSNDRLVEHAKNYLTALELNAKEPQPTLPWPSKRPFVAARERLRRLDVRGIPYRRVLLSAKDAPPVRASAVFSPAALEFLASRGDVQVPGAFTASGWQKIRETLHSPAPLPPSARVERWVLDDASLPQDEPSLRASIMQAYFDEYTRRWMSFLDELRVKTPSDVDTAKAELTAFKEGDGFYKGLFDAFKQNTIHDDVSTADVDAGGLLSRLPWFKSDADAGTKAAAPPSPVEKSFHPLLAFGGDLPAEGAKAAGTAPLDKYIEILDKLKAALEAPPAPPSPGQSARSPFTDASNGVSELLDGVEEPTRGRLWRLLMPPVMGGVQAAKAAGVGSLSTDWTSGVWTAWDQKLRTRRPFARSPRAEPANFGDFAAFFRPDGILWGFVKSHLADLVEENGDGRYVMKQGADPLAPDLLGCLTIAQQITDAFFVPGEDPGLKLSVESDWNAPDVSNAKFWIGSKDTALPQGQWAGPVRWFGEDVRVEWLQGGRPTQELGRHSFSLFDLFEQLGGLKASTGSRSIYAVDCPPLTLKIRPEGKVDGLKADFFDRLTCPEDIHSEKP